MSTLPPPAQRVSPWSRLLLAACVVFILTVFLMVAAAFNRQAGRIARFFDDRGLLILCVEVGAILGLSVVALGAERRQAARQRREQEAALLEGPRGSERSETAARGDLAPHFDRSEDESSRRPSSSEP